VYYSDLTASAEDQRQQLLKHSVETEAEDNVNKGTYKLSSLTDRLGLASGSSSGSSFSDTGRRVVTIVTEEGASRRFCGAVIVWPMARLS
jgi:hypothetical protein